MSESRRCIVCKVMRNEGKTALYHALLFQTIFEKVLLLLSHETTRYYHKHFLKYLNDMLVDIQRYLQCFYRIEN